MRFAWILSIPTTLSSLRLCFTLSSSQDRIGSLLSPLIDSEKQVLNPSMSFSIYWLYNSLQYFIYLSSTLYLCEITSFPFNCDWHKHLSFSNYFQSFESFIVSPLIEYLSTCLQSCVIHCSLASFISLLTSLLNLLYSSAAEVHWNLRIFITFYFPHKSSISSVIQFCFFSFLLLTTSRAVSCIVSSKVSTRSLLSVSAMDNTAYFLPVVASKPAPMFGSLRFSKLDTSLGSHFCSFFLNFSLMDVNTKLWSFHCWPLDSIWF